jgi:hypothetical protein
MLRALLKAVRGRNLENLELAGVVVVGGMVVSLSLVRDERKPSLVLDLVLEGELVVCSNLEAARERLRLLSGTSDEATCRRKLVCCSLEEEGEDGLLPASLLLLEE